MTIIVEVKNDILGNSEFWRGDERVCGMSARNCHAAHSDSAA